jgi:hypothetical protein
MAMISHRFGHTPEARYGLDMAHQIADQKFPKTQGGRPGEGWHDWLIFQIIRREAETLLKNSGGEKETNHESHE